MAPRALTLPSSKSLRRCDQGPLRLAPRLCFLETSTPTPSPPHPHPRVCRSLSSSSSPIFPSSSQRWTHLYLDKGGALPGSHPTDGSTAGLALLPPHRLPPAQVAAVDAIVSGAGVASGPRARIDVYQTGAEAAAGIRAPPLLGAELYSQQQQQGSYLQHEPGEPAAFMQPPR